MGQRLKATRVAAGYTNQARFCDLVQIRPGTLWRYENGQLAPGAKTIERLASVLGVSTDYLMLRTDDKTPRVDGADEDLFRLWLEHGSHGELTEDEVRRLQRLPRFNKHTAAFTYFATALDMVRQGFHGEELEKGARFTTEVKQRSRSKPR
jgi:transcriptional regulator with XRE-family HTH domain